MSEEESITATSATIITVPQDVSRRALSIARTIDRLPPGEYNLSLVKPGVKAADWQIEIVRTERLERAVLKKYLPE